MIILGLDCSEQYEAMKRGEWPEPHPAVLAAHERLRLVVVDEYEGPESEEPEEIDS